MRRVVIAAVLGLAGVAHAQRSYLEEPTGGLALPTTPLAGEHDARAVTVNPGGLALIRGSELALALDVQDTGVATATGQGLGAYWARAFGGGLLPRFGLGLAVEGLRPPRGQLTPDPDRALRVSFAFAAPLGASGGLGLVWHHFRSDGPLDGADTVDLGLSYRLDNHAAFGATLRDLATRDVAGTAVQRRYEAELVLRPLGRDSLELGVGGRIGEDRGNLDGWLRASLRVVRGLDVLAQAEARALRFVDAGVTRDDHELRGTLGLALSFGDYGVSTFATGLRDERGANHALGGSVVVRASSAGPPSVVATPDHIERVELSGELTSREITQIVVRLRAISRDPTARAVIVTLDGANTGWGALEEIRDELVRLRTSKKVFAYMVSGTARDYYIATAAHKIYIDPAGGLRLVGIAGTTMYFRGAFDQFGVLPQFEKIAEYKSAPEQFTETGPTVIAARMRGELYDSLWNRWVDEVAAARALTPDELRALVDQGPFSAGDLARDHRLVDAVAGPDRISQLITSEIGAILPLGAPDVDRPERWQRPGVAVIYVDGDITDGKSQAVPFLNRSLAGGETLIGAIERARSDPRIGAIILRIDSPGGSALASELIAREIFETRGVKPVLCSMSNVAASGGYFVAAGCDLIFAEPMTITGSIGIFTGKLDISGLARKLGVGTDTWKRGRHADVESLFRPYTDEERALLQDKLRYQYGRFVGAVAEGRNLSKDAVDAVGRGHVWSGAQALPIKLVDRFGGLADALDEARRRIGLAENTRVQLYELPDRPASLFGALGNLLGVHADAHLELTDLPAVKQLLQGIPASLLFGGGLQARLPFDIVWE